MSFALFFLSRIINVQNVSGLFGLQNQEYGHIFLLFCNNDMDE